MTAPICALGTAIWLAIALHLIHAAYGNGPYKACSDKGSIAETVNCDQATKGQTH